MSIRRVAVMVFGTALALAIGFHYGSDLYFQYFKFGPAFIPAPPPQPKPLAGKNSISNLTLRQTAPGTWQADFDYFYTGDPPWAKLEIELGGASGATDGTVGPEMLHTSLPQPQRGAHHVSHQIPYPRAQVETRMVTVMLVHQIDEVITSEQVTQRIDWPDFATWIRNQQLALGTPQEHLNRATALIDGGDENGLAEAKTVLEQLIAEDPRFDGAYVQLARVALNQNDNAQGMRDAEGLLGSALQIRPDNIDAKILLGNVYAHEKHFAQAQALFADADKSNPPNLWLYENWGELYLMQGNVDQAIAKFRQTISRPMSHDGYDRARNQAYLQLLDLLGRRKDYDGMEALYQQRIAEFGPGACYTVDYAQFKLQIRGDTQGAIDLARGALNQNCEDSSARKLLGMAEYVKWADAGDAGDASALNQARVFLPPGPNALYRLATGERSLRALKKLLDSGENIDEHDGDQMSALAYALQSDDLPAARHLLTLGANPESPVGPRAMPVALIPVMEQNIAGIHLMKQAGVDYSKLRFLGHTALDYARQFGSKELVEALSGSGTTL